MNGHKLDSAETSVDTSHKLVDRRTKILVLLDVTARWNSQLHEYDLYATAVFSTMIGRFTTPRYLADPFRMLRKEHLESMKLLRDTLDVIQTVDTDDDLDPIESLFECLEFLLDGIRFETLHRIDCQILSQRYIPDVSHIDELLGVNADWESAHMGVSALIEETVGHGGHTENAGTGGEEMAGIVVGVEAEEIAR